jgi:hypothetical protein
LPAVESQAAVDAEATWLQPVGRGGRQQGDACPGYMPG